jgi:hypothetical protein
MHRYRYLEYCTYRVIAGFTPLYNPTCGPFLINMKVIFRLRIGIWRFTRHNSPTNQALAEECPSKRSTVQAYGNLLDEKSFVGSIPMQWCRVRLGMFSPSIALRWWCVGFASFALLLLALFILTFFPMCFCGTHCFLCETSSAYLLSTEKTTKHRSTI